MNSKIFVFAVVRLRSTWKGGDNDHLITRLRKSAEFDHISNFITNSKIFVFVIFLWPTWKGGDNDHLNI